MLANKRADTKPEMQLRSELHRRGRRFRKDRPIDLGDIRTRPDIVFTRAKVAVFVDGCFWHCCPEHGTLPRRNAEYWTPKLARNVERDRLHDAALQAGGWTVIRLWEHLPVIEAADLVDAAIDGRSDSNIEAAT